MNIKNLQDFDILYEDKYMLVINKPAGWVIQGAYKKEESLLDFIKNFIKRRDNKPGNVFLGVVHRLDKPVSGALILAKRSKIAKKFLKIFQKKEILKIYLAEVEGFFKGEGIWEDYIFWDDRQRKAIIINNTQNKEAKKAITYYFSLESSQKSKILLIPLTGRKHQLRAVLSKRGLPVIGDIKYGSRIRIKGGRAILLHALFLKFLHPMTEEEIFIKAPLPEYFIIQNLDKRLKLEFLNKLSKRLEGKYYVSS